jgi:phosphatidylglycerol:prolipoprotein diacylglycerol transferase
VIAYPDIPTGFSIGPVKIHWYGMMYLVGFAAAWLLGRARAHKAGWSAEQVSDLIFYGALGAVLGGRLGYILFYDLAAYLADPLAVFRVWEGGMAFHGGLLGVIVAMLLLARQQQRSFWAVADFTAPLVPIGLLAGRLGNFINGELWGRVTDVPWAMVFPRDPEQLARHPSQLYQAALEGMLLFVLLWLYSARPRATGKIAGMFLLGYGTLRFIGEGFRQPDAHIGFVALGWMSMGQALSLPMMVFGLWIWFWAQRRSLKTIS